MSTNWYKEVIDILSIQQAEVFILHGDVHGYPEFPGEMLGDFLRRMTWAPIRKQLEDELPEGEVWIDLPQEQQDRQLAEKGLFFSLSPASGLTFANGAQQEVFDRYAPSPESNPFAAPGNGLLDWFARLHTYFRNPDAVPLTLVLEDADLLFDGDGPLVEPERILISYIRSWANTPLVAGSGLHRVFLVTPFEQGIRSALRQGRVASVKIPLPDEESRKGFIDLVLDNAAEDPERSDLQLEEGLTRTQLAHITGALNLVHVEDVIYRAELEGGVITRGIAQARKDALVSQAYAGIIEIQYPEMGFDDIVGFEALKAYMTGYVYRKLITADRRCPKGCILSGPPGVGKSVFAMGLAHALKLPLVVVRTDRIKNKFVGESNKNMARLCEGIVTLAPAIVLIDEIDKVMPSGDDSTGVSQEILGQLQTFRAEIPRGKAFFIGTTNYPGIIPRALLRPGRFEQCIPLLPQHLDGRRGEVLQRIGDRMGVPFASSLRGADFDEVGQKASDYTGADMEKLLIEADREATEQGRERIEKEDLLQALEYVVPTLRSTQPMVEEALEFCSNRRFVPDSLREQVGLVQKEGGTVDKPKGRRVRQVG